MKKSRPSKKLSASAPLREPNNEDSKPSLVPKLRFPEFQNAPNWSTKPLGELGDFSSGGTPSKDNPEYWNGHIPWISASSMHTTAIAKSDHHVSSKAIGNGTRIAPKGSFLILVRGSMLFNRVPMGIAEIDVAFNQDVKSLAPNGGVNTQFLLYFLSAVESQIPINETGIGAGKIDTDVLKAFPVPFPATAEQQKIAECLSSVDELMAAQGRKVDALKTHKKGLMQQLFPREGETQPRLRFPEFQNAEEWEEDTLDDIATFRRGSFPQPYGLPEWYDEKNGMPFIQVFDVGVDFRLKDKTKSKISKLGAERSVFIPKGTLIVTLQGSIGRVAITHYDAYIDRTLLIFESFRKPIEKVFFARVIQNLFDIEKEKAPGGIIKTITKEALSDFKVKYPMIDEQERIASCLSSLDALIAAETQKHAALQRHKRGLMQQLFPSPGESS
jgi:type I restriction enzyme S subunit